MKLGSSPSDLTDFFHIKEQINYLNREGKTTDWKKVKRLSEKLLAENGTDLQTLVYLTVANDKLTSDFHQLNHDIEILAIALVSYWDEIWPQDISARITILNWLNRQISHSVRGCHLNQQNFQDYFKLSNSLSLITSTLTTTQEDASHLAYLLDFVMQEINLFKTNTIPLLNVDEVEHHNVITPLIPTLKPTSLTTDEPVKKAFPENLENQAVENTSSFVKNENKPMRKMTPWRYLLGGFIGGAVLCAFISYCLIAWNTHQLNKQLERVIDSPAELVNMVYLSFAYQNDETKRNLQDKADDYGKQGRQFIKPDGVTPKLAKLQSDLLQAEKNKQGLTISYLKTSLYEIEKELHTMSCLECDISHYQTNPTDTALEQNLNHRILALLFYYHQFTSSQSTQEKQGQ